MKPLLQLGAAAWLAAGAALLCAPQVEPPPSANRDILLPSGKSQQEEILKADHAKDLKDAAQLIELSEQLKEELEKNDRHVLSISSLKKTEEIEKLAKRIRGRLRRF
jgi:GTP-binding protein EngB required for normal cell division